MRVRGFFLKYPFTGTKVVFPEGEGGDGYSKEEIDQKIGQLISALQDKIDSSEFNDGGDLDQKYIDASELSDALNQMQEQINADLKMKADLYDRDPDDENPDDLEVVPSQLPPGYDGNNWEGENNN